MNRKQTETLTRSVLGQIKRRNDFFESPKFDRLIELFRTEVEKNGPLHQQDIAAARPGRYPFTDVEFCNVFNAVSRKAAGPSVIYRGLSFHGTTGQGATYSIAKAEPA